MYWIETIDSLDFIDYQEFGKVFPHQYFFECCKDPGSAAVGARLFGKAVGFAMAVRRNNRWIGIGVYVFSCYRRMGIGMALLEKLVCPRKPITAHVYRAQPAIHSIAELDAWIAGDLSAAKLASKPFTPLPVLGVPGWWPGNEDVSFYDDATVFRPRR